MRRCVALIFNPFNPDFHACAPGWNVVFVLQVEKGILIAGGFPVNRVTGVVA